MGLTRKTASLIVNTDTDQIPKSAFEHAKLALMDWLAVTLAGKDDPLVVKLINYSNQLGGYEQATILGHGIKKNISQAALINGGASHALDYDDTLEIMLGHPTVTLYPALLAIAEWKDISIRDLLTAYLVGLKVTAVIGSCGIMDHYMSGWHATSTIGHFASAAGCARLLGLDEQQTVYALGIAGTQASGLKSAFGTMCKPFHAGKSSQAGMMAAMLAGDGFTSAGDILEGANGFLQVLNGKLNDKALDALNGRWGEVEDLAQKYHASCHDTHSPIEGALAIVEKEELNIDDIKSINISVSQLALGVAGKTEPKTALEGKFSISYCVANALLRGNTGPLAFTDEKVSDQKIQDLMRKIFLESNKDFKLLEAIVKIETNAGKVITEAIDVLKDIPDLENKKIKIKDKFLDLTSPVLGNDKAKALVATIMTLDLKNNVQVLLNTI